MLNTEIGKTGEVIVEGHVIGRLDGFMFAPDTADAGSETKALQAAAQKALAGEIDARAQKLGQAPDDQFVLASDGTIRWTGDAVAKLAAGDDALHPRIRIVADERLTGAPRDAVQARLDLWLKTHVEKLLGPLFELAKAEDVTGIARGIAFQLIEGLGVLERSKVAQEVKELDQTARAALRKYGVRFGAYHIYVPSLLKPAARALASQLWAHKQDNVDLGALSSAQHLAASGRTSFPVDKSLSRDAYRVLGYRQCGERAVRVDILERLADLIRPALAWRAGTAVPKPAGAFDGRGFVVTQAMTSLTGSAGEDFASILRALGYRMELRPAPAPAPEPAAEEAAAGRDEAASAAESNPGEAPAADAAPAAAEEEAASDRAGEEATPGAVDAAAAVDQPADSAAVSSIAQQADHETEGHATLQAPDAAAPEQRAPDAEAEAMADAKADSSVPPTVEAAVREAGEVEPEGADAQASQTAIGEAVSSAGSAEATPEEVAAPPMVEVWRPGGRSEDRRPRHERHHHRSRGSQQGGQAAGADAREDGTKAPRPGRGRRDRPFEAKRPDRSHGAAGAGPQQGTGQDTGEGKGRPPRDRSHEKGRDKGKFHAGRDGRPGKGGPAVRPFASSAPRERDRDRPVDPNSPFAKLAALKEQLAGRKDAN